MGWITFMLQIFLQSVAPGHLDGQDGQDGAGNGSHIDLDDLGNI